MLAINRSVEHLDNKTKKVIINHKKVLLKNYQTKIHTLSFKQREMLLVNSRYHETVIDEMIDKKRKLSRKEKKKIYKDSLSFYKRVLSR